MKYKYIFTQISTVIRFESLLKSMFCFEQIRPIFLVSRNMPLPTSEYLEQAPSSFTLLNDFQQYLYVISFRHTAM